MVCTKAILHFVSFALEIFARISKLRLIQTENVKNSVF